MDKKTIYIAGCSKDGGIYTVELSENEGAKIIHKTPCNSPMYIAHEGKYLYVILEGDEESRLVRYTEGEDGVLTDFTDLGGTNGKCACHISVKDGISYVVNYLSGNVSKIPGKTVFHSGCGKHPTRQETAHTHQAHLTPDGKYILITDLGLDTIFTYTFDLNEVSKAKVDDSEGCRHLVFSKDGTLCYCANELGNSVTVFEYNDGHLTKKDTYSTLDGNYCDKSTVAAIRNHEGYIYVSNRGHNSVTAFRIEGNTLKRESITDISGNFPRDFDIFGDIMVVTNEKSNTITFFKVEGSKLTKKSYELDIPSPLCVIE